MGENLDAEGRAAVRTPMQWSRGENGGFSTAPAKALASPVVEGGYAPEHVNVEDQRRSGDSLLAFMSLLVRRYRESPELGWGSFEVLEQPHPAVLACRRTWDAASMVALHNLGPDPVLVPVRLEDCPPGTCLLDLLQDATTDLDDRGAADLELGRYGYRWLRIVAPGDRRLL